MRLPGLVVLFVLSAVVRLTRAAALNFVSRSERASQHGASVARKCALQVRDARLMSDY